jgi:hypothetical protein
MGRWAWLRFFFYGLAVLFLLAAVLGPGPNGYGKAIRDLTCRKVDEIATAMYRYSLDHGGKYPSGNSSTTVFQKLLDGGYVSDPETFYDRYISPEVKKTATSKTLAPENVSFDVTVPVTAGSPKGLPLVFVSGFKVTYEPGASATAPFHSLGQISGMAAAYNDDVHPSNFITGLLGRPSVTYQKIDFYKSSTDVLRRVPNFIPATFHPDGNVYVQLTPDGPLP